MSDAALDFRIIHPLDDAEETKLFRPELGRLRLSRTARVSLLLLRVYLGAMVLLVGARLIGL